MTTTPERQALIEKAAKAMQERMTWPSLHWPKVGAIHHADVAAALAEAALAVFEESQKPTDDEREALRSALRQKVGVYYSHEETEAVMDVVFDLGFRRPVSPEPQTEPTDAQVKAGAEAAIEVIVRTSDITDWVRAALRAAFTTGQGENRG